MQQVGTPAHIFFYADLGADERSNTAQYMKPGLIQLFFRCSKVAVFLVRANV